MKRGDKIDDDDDDDDDERIWRNPFFLIHDEKTENGFNLFFNLIF